MNITLHPNTTTMQPKRKRYWRILGPFNKTIHTLKGTELHAQEWANVYERVSGFRTSYKAIQARV